MPCSFAFDLEKQVVFIAATGVVTDADLIGLSTILQADPRFRRDMRCLADCSGAKTLAATAGMMSSLATTQPFLPGARRAFLAPAGLIGGAVRLYRSQTTGQAEVFSNRAEALSWLNEGVPADQAIS